MSCGNGKLTTSSYSFDGIYRGQVVSTSDPDQLGRIKVRVFGVFGDSIAVADLPWAVPAFSLLSGSGSGYGCWCVPEVNSQVFVFFEGQDVYQPVYFAEAPSKVCGQPSERSTNYPYRKIQKTKSGIVVFIDDQSKVVQLTHPSGKIIQMDGSGNVTITANELTVTASGNVTISGSQVDINP